jgi:hypothetical protein
VGMLVGIVVVVLLLLLAEARWVVCHPHVVAHTVGFAYTLTQTLPHTNAGE